MVSRPRSRSPVSRPLTTVVFSVDPSTNPNGCFVPSMSMPNATTHRCSAKYTPSIITATKSSVERSVPSRSANALSVIATNLRDTADLLVDLDVSSTAWPTGSRPAGYRLVETPASIRSNAILPSSSVPLNSSYDGTGTSLLPSAARTRGRATGTRRPPRVTEPRSVPCRVATRSGSCLPRGPHAAATSASINWAITCSPAPTARASSPSRMSAAISSIATLTCSGTASALVSAALV